MAQKLERLFDGTQRIDGFYYDPTTDTIYFSKSIGGKRFTFSTKVKRPNLVHAKRVANQRLKDILGTRRTNVRSLIKDEIPKWKASKELEGLDPATMLVIERTIPRIENFWGSMLPSEISRDSVDEWVRWLALEYPGTQKFNAIKYMKNFCRYLAEKGLLPVVPRIVDPDAKAVKAARKRRKARIFTKAEFKAVYAAADERERLVALFMYTMGTRIEETLSLRFNREIFLNEDPPVYRWTIGQNKADHEGKHALHPKLIPILKKFQRPDTDFLFPQTTNLKKPISAQYIDFNAWRLRSKLDWHWTSHTFRHTCLSNLFNNAKNPQALICRLYRVSLAVALETYVKTTKEGMEQMREAIEVDI